MQFRHEEKETILKHFPQGLVLFDLETTGLSPLSDEIIEIAAIKLSPNLDTQTFCSFIRPTQPIPALTTKIHNITDEMVANAPPLENTFNNFVQFCEDLTLMAHNALFDFSFLLGAFDKLNIRHPKQKIYCSVKLARYLSPGSVNNKLSSLAKHFNINTGSQHRALDDTKTLWGVLYHLLKNRSLKKKDWRAKSLQYNSRKIAKEDLVYDEEKFEQLILGLQKNLFVEIIYNGGTIKNRPRQVKPVGLVAANQGPALYAKCMNSGHFKSFYLKRISSYTMLEGASIDEKA